MKALSTEQKEKVNELFGKRAKNLRYLQYDDDKLYCCSLECAVDFLHILELEHTDFDFVTKEDLGRIGIVSSRHETAREFISILKSLENENN
jgi:hypothetical protein